MKTKRPPRVLLWIFIVLGLCAAVLLLYDRGRPAPIPMKRELFEGVTYRRVVRLTPQPMIAHVIVIDTKLKEIGLLVTPPDSDGELPLKARTTSQFLDEFGVQIAINGDGFDPWWSNSPADYYPHVGDPIAPLGFTASNGKIYWSGNTDEP